MTTPEGGTGPAATPPGNPGGQQPAPLPMFTQEQVNSFAAQEKRGAVGSFFKELGFDTVPSKEELTAAIQAQRSQQGDVQRLTGELEAAKGFKTQAETLQQTVLRQQIAGDLSLPPRFWKFVDGATEDEIKASVQGLFKDLNLTPPGEGTGQQPPQQDQPGAPRPPAPAPQQGTGTGTPPPAKTMESGAAAYHAKHGNKKD